MKSPICVNGHDKTVVGVYKNGACKPCAKARAAAWFNNNRERHYKNERRWHHANLERSRNHRRKANWKRYGFTFTPEQYAALWEQQRGRCAICDRHDSEFQKRLSVDHNHETGQVRGLLCSPCNNRFVAFLEDKSGTLEKAQAYLAKFQEAA